MKIDKTKIGLLIILIITISWLVITMNNNRVLRVNNNISQQNNKALSDSLRISKNKVNDIEFSKQILVTDKKNLTNLNKELSDELKITKGKVFELTKFIVNIKPEEKIVEVPTTVTKYPEGVNGLKWDYKKVFDVNNYRIISGESKFSIDGDGEIISLGTNIFKNEINFSVTQGLREKDGSLEMYVRSDYPGFNLTDLNSVIIDPDKHPIISKFTKKKKFGFSLYGGYGITVINNDVKVGPQIGVGLTYDLFQF